MKGKKSQGFIETIGRKKIVIGLIILIILLLITSIKCMIEAINDNKVEQIVYTESSIIDYNVYLKENDFYGKEYLEKDKQYIASLIKNITAKFKYQLSSANYKSDYNYSYKIVADLNVEEPSNGKNIYTIRDTLVEEKKFNLKNTSKIDIYGQVEIDYNKYNNIIKNFAKIYGLDDINPTVTVKMFVTVDGITRSSLPVSSLVIPLTTKTVAIDISSNTVNATEMNIYKEIANKNNYYIAILTFILVITLTVELFIFINGSKDEKARFKTKVKKIIMNYDSYIQKTQNDFEFEGYQEITLKTFEDLLQIRDTISQPILMKEKDTEVEFFIPSKGNVVYVYRFNIKDMKEKNNK